MKSRKHLKDPRASAAGCVDEFEVMIIMMFCGLFALFVWAVGSMVFKPVMYSVGDNQAAYLYPEGQVVTQKGSHLQVEPGAHGVYGYALRGVSLSFDDSAASAGDEKAEDLVSSVQASKVSFADADCAPCEASARVVVDFDEQAVSYLGSLYGSQRDALAAKVVPDARASIAAAAAAAPDFSAASLRAVEKAVQEDLAQKWAGTGLSVSSVDFLSVAKG